jgi:hypothetical protein
MHRIIGNFFPKFRARVKLIVFGLHFIAQLANKAYGIETCVLDVVGRGLSASLLSRERRYKAIEKWLIFWEGK